MGKKSKRRTAKSATKQAESPKNQSHNELPTLSPPKDGLAHELDRATKQVDSPKNQSHNELPTLSLPKGGWAHALDRAKTAAKKKPGDVGRLLRLSRAQRMLRQWHKLAATAEEALRLVDASHLPDADGTVRELLSYRREAARQRAADSSVGRPELRRWLAEFAVAEGTADSEVFLQATFHNLNCMQYAAIHGDMWLLEKVVALGACLDLPPIVRPEKSTADDVDGAEAAPQGCTALLLACASLAQYGIVEKMPGLIAEDLLTEKLKEVLGGQLECAVQLVRLGADCGTRMDLSSGASGLVTNMWQGFGFDGKTARELAALTGRRELVDVMKTFEDKKDMVRLAHCRCGSRLPWRECHLGLLPKETLFREKDGQVSFRLSPLAPCCKKTNKKHLNCCWSSSKPMYLDDKRGVLNKTTIIVGRKSTDDEALAQMEDYVEGKKMDHRVYAGIITRLYPNDYFAWMDEHWTLETTAMLARVEEWNVALEQYCDDVGLRGGERKDTIALHRATPFARCGNSGCGRREKKVREFATCTRCRAIGYCSRSCQKAHWKTHIRMCVAR